MSWNDAKVRYVGCNVSDLCMAYDTEAPVKSWSFSVLNMRWLKEAHKIMYFEEQPSELFAKSKAQKQNQNCVESTQIQYKILCDSNMSCWSDVLQVFSFHTFLILFSDWNRF